MKLTNVKDLEEKAKEIRKDILTQIYLAGSGHPRRFSFMCRYYDCFIF